jgi:hypothetical protein
MPTSPRSRRTPLRRLRLALAELTLLTAFEGPARAQTQPDPPSARFGSPGQFVVTGGSDVAVSSTSYSASQANGLAATFSPALQYFIVRDVSIGLDVGLSYSDDKGYGADGSLVETKTTSIYAGPRIGVNIPLSRVVSFYPNFSLGFQWRKQDEQLISGLSLSIAGSAVGYPSSSQLGPYVDLYLPLLFHPTSHFFMGIGPGFYHDFGTVSGGPSVGGQRTTISAGFVVGGYWGEQRVVMASTGVGPPEEQPRVFGQKGEWVLGNELAASVSYTSYAGIGSSGTGVNLYGGFDYFVTNGFSIGGGLWTSVGTTTGIDAVSGSQVAASVRGAGLFARLGLNVPMASWISWYPRFAMAFGMRNDEETSGEYQNSPSETVVSVTGFAPLLVHPAQHFFVGFGPSISHDLSHAVSYVDYANINGGIQIQNQATTIGVGLVVGGWLSRGAKKPN